MTTARSDAITLEIIQNSLQAISGEMFSSMRKTAMSAIIYEVLDMGTCITDAEGDLAASGAGIPAFVATLDKAVKRIIDLNATAPCSALSMVTPSTVRRRLPRLATACMSTVSR